jgi:Bacterial Ig-like domain (group 3)
VTQLSPGSILPTGKVTFLDGSTMLGDADLINGQATVSVANLAVGTHALKIAYFGDVHFLASTSDVLDQVVIKYASDTVALTASNYSPFVGQPVTLTATVTGLPPGTSTPTALSASGAARSYWAPLSS